MRYFTLYNVNKALEMTKNLESLGLGELLCLLRMNKPSIQQSGEGGEVAFFSLVPNGNVSGVSLDPSHSAVRQRVDGGADVACVVVGLYSCQDHDIADVSCVSDVACVSAGMVRGREKYGFANPANTSSCERYKTEITGHFVPYVPEVIEDTHESTLSTPNYSKRTPPVTIINLKRNGNALNKYPV